MNWFTKGFGVVVTEMMDPCEHLKEGDTAHVVHTERDSFGLVGQNALCEACEDARIEEEAEELIYCHDCKKEHKASKVTQWRWYDFYAPQGDIPMNICDECWAAPKHQARMEKDARDYQAEMSGNYFDDDEDEYYD